MNKEIKEFSVLVSIDIKYWEVLRLIILIQTQLKKTDCV